MNNKKIKLKDTEEELVYSAKTNAAIKYDNNLLNINDVIQEYSYSDIFYPQRYYMAKWGKFANKFIFYFTEDYLDDYPDTEKFMFDMENALKAFKKTYGEDKVTVLDDSRLNQKDELTDRQTYIIIGGSYHLILYVESAPCRMCIYYDNFNDALKLKDLFTKYIIRITDGNKIKKEISYIVKTQSGYDLIHSNIKHFAVDIDEQYNDDFAPRHEQIKAFLNEENKSGLVILSGSPGTGKTTYIRHLIETTKRKFVYLTSELANALMDPTFISFLYVIKGSVLILEDCENLVKNRENDNPYYGISTILNMCDGLMGDVFDLKIITTFNTDVSNIDQALLRKGRLVSRYEFGKLSVKKANAIFKKLGKSFRTKEDMALCDIYNIDNDCNQDINNKCEKIGF